MIEERIVYTDNLFEVRVDELFYTVTTKDGTWYWDRKDASYSDLN